MKKFINKRAVISVLVMLSLVLGSFGIACAGSNVTQAQTNGTTVKTYAVPAAQVEKQHQDCVNRELERLNSEKGSSLQSSSTDSLKVVKYIYKSVAAGSETKTNVKIGWANGQPVNGYVFGSPGGQLHWQDDSGTPITISLSLAWKALSVSVSPGSTGSTGEEVPVPDAFVNRAVKLQINKDLTTYRNGYYRAIAGTSNWTFLYYLYDTQTTRVYFNVKLAS